MKTRITLLAVAFCAAATQAGAVTNLVQNGNFTDYSAPTASYNGGTVTVGQLATTDANAPGYVNAKGGDTTGGGTAAGWSSDGYTYLFTPGSADTTGSYSNRNFQEITLWGSNNGGSAVLPATSPAGGNYLALDGDPSYNGALYQTVSGLAVGSYYSLSFYFAGAMQSNRDAITTEQFLVNVGSAVPASNGAYQFQTVTLTTPDKGFTPWQQATFTFTATATSEVLSFLSTGTPAGAPPFGLLDGVSITYAPEPATWATMVAGLAFVVLGGRAWRRRSTQAATA